jgi:hypothetical protein
MTDRELLEDAAKAAGIKVRIYHDMIVERGTDCVCVDHRGFQWNPIINSGDAFELAMKLRLDIGFEKLHMVSVWCRSVDDWVTEHCDDGMGSDIAEKTRRAIVRAAAAIGKEMK